MSNYINPPLAAHFIWHQKDNDQFDDICGIFRKYLTRDIDRPFSRELNIPTFFYSSLDFPPNDIPISIAKRNIIFIC